MIKHKESFPGWRLVKPCKNEQTSFLKTFNQKNYFLIGVSTQKCVYEGFNIKHISRPLAHVIDGVLVKRFLR